MSLIKLKRNRLRRISANYIFPISTPPLKNGIIELDDNNVVTNVIDTKGDIKEIEKLEFYNGILVPGFVNAHCHLELSYLRGFIEGNGEGLPKFLSEVMSKRFGLPDNLDEIIRKADEEMQAEGIVAVGDISNSEFSLRIKAQSKIYYHNFIEVFRMEPEKADEVYNQGVALFQKAKSLNMASSIVPHAPYTMSVPLLQKIKDSYHELNADQVFSLHNQESDEENAMFLNRTGKLVELFDKFGMDSSAFKATGKRSLESMVPYFPEAANILLIHNIFTCQEDIDNIVDFKDKLFWVTCPKSNLIIENKLPDYDLFGSNKLCIAMGTDSYSSNTSLSILDEIKTISKNCPKIQLEELVRWATLNGAKALKIDHIFGSFEVGKSPGVNLISGIDFRAMKLIESTSVKSLV